jgi:hypothetical protein
MPKSRKRKPRPHRPPAVRTPGSTLSGRLAEQRRYEELFGKALAGAPPDILPVMLPALKWLHAQVEPGNPGIHNRCVDAAFGLQVAYRQLGIRAEVLPVDLVVRDERANIVMHGRPEPRWDGAMYDGHCILYLPDAQRFVDVTAEQYPQISRFRIGPIVGRVAPGQASVGALPPPGGTFVVPRGDVLLMYTTASEESRAHLHASPVIEQAKETYRRVGVNLASHTVECLRHPAVVERATAAPYPRLRALLAAVGDAPFDTADDDQVWYFKMAGQDGAVRRVRLDELVLPPGTPEAV